MKLEKNIGFTFRYIDVVLLLTNFKFGNYIDLIYLIKLEIKYNIETERFAEYLDLNLEIASTGDFPIVNLRSCKETFQ